MNKSRTGLLACILVLPFGSAMVVRARPGNLVATVTFGAGKVQSISDGRTPL